MLVKDDIGVVRKGGQRQVVTRQDIAVLNVRQPGADADGESASSATESSMRMLGPMLAGTTFGCLIGRLMPMGILSWTAIRVD